MLEERMLSDAEIDDAMTELLAIVYNSINWSKIKTSKNPHDIFNHRVRAASRMMGLRGAISKLCNYFGLQSLPAEAIPLIERLRPYERTVLSRMYTEHIVVSMSAILRAKQIKGRLKARDAKKDQEVEEKDVQGA